MSDTHEPPFLSPVWTHLTDLRPVRGEGAWLTGEDGERWLDFTSGIGVTNTGHAHPRIARAVADQASALFFGQANIVRLPQAEALARRLREVTPRGIETFFFSNSGAEAVEAAVKLARHATRRSNLIVFQGSFHGRTHQAMAMTTSKTVYRHRYAPLPSGAFVAPFPKDEEAVPAALDALDLLLATQTAPDETAAMVVEPVLGEGGYLPAPASFLRGLRERCDRHGVLLILDEVQTGFGRTGRMFAADHHDLVPDVLVMAKGMGSGFPISGIGASAELMDRWEPGTHGGTYGGGNAVVLAAALATMDVLEEEDLISNAARRGEQLREGIASALADHGVAASVRGLGLMIGVEFTRDGRPDGATAGAVQRACLDGNMLLLTCGTAGQVIRWIPPLVIGDAEIEHALAVFGRALERTASAVA